MKSEYQLQAENFFRQSGASIDIVRVGEVRGFPFDESDRNMHAKYQITLRRGGRSYTFPFYDSAERSGKANKRPSAYDVLACLEKYPVTQSVWDFAVEFGYTINSEKSYNRVSHIRSACNDQYNKLVYLFGKKWMDKLREIN